MKRLFAALSMSCLMLIPLSVQADIDGFSVNGIEGKDALTLDDRFGTSASSSEHLVNYLDCLLYNGETSEDSTTETTTAALEGEGDAASSSDGGDATGGDTTGGDTTGDDTTDGQSGSDVTIPDADTSDASDASDMSDTTVGEDLNSSDDGGLPFDLGDWSDSFDGSSDTTTTTLGPSGTVEFDVTLFDPFGDDWKYAVKVGSCDTSQSITSDETDDCFYAVKDTDLTSFSSIVFDVEVRMLIGTYDGASESSVACDTLLGTTGERRVYFQIQQGDDTATLYTHEILIQFDYDPPEAPTDLEAEAGESNVQLSWTDELNGSESDTRYQVYYASETFGEDDLENVFTTDTMSTTETQVEDLDNGSSYFFRVVALDDYDNRSDLSEELEAEPIPVNDFFEQYKEAGGKETGGYCGVSDTPSSWVTFLILLAILVTSFLSLRFLGVRGRHLLMALIISGGGLIAVSDAQAKSPVNWTMNLRFGNYMPAIDSEFDAGTTGPYSQIFDNDSMMLYRAELGYLLSDQFGSLFFTWQAGYGSVTGYGIEVGSGDESTDSTTLHVVPLSFSLFYEFDQIARSYGFPLIPYLRAGIDYNLWWITDGVGDVAQFSDEDGANYSAKGGTLGGHFTIGLRLLLDSFAPGMAREFDDDLGFNQSYLFMEMTQLTVNDGDSETSFDLSDTLFSFGLGFDF